MNRFHQYWSRWTFVSLLSVVGCLSATLAGQQAPIVQLGAVISGKVTDQDGRTAISGAIVSLAGEVATVRQTVGADGAFKFEGLAAGTYVVVVTKVGYADGAYGRLWPDAPASRLDLATDEQVTDASVRLWKLGSIGGAVYDESDDPLVGVRVCALRRASVAGRMRLVITAESKTDENGQYRLGALLPGNYELVVPASYTTFPPELSATASSRLSGSRAGDVFVMPSNGLPTTTGRSSRRQVYPTTFWGSTGPGSDGAVIRLQPGAASMGADFHLTPTDAFSISGTLRSSTGPLPWTLVRLLPEATSAMIADSGFESAVAVTRSNGEFRLQDVPAGQYTLRVLKVPDRRPPPLALQLEMIYSTLDRGPEAASSAAAAVGIHRLPPPPLQPTLTAIERVSVEDRDVELNVTAGSAPRIAGHIAFEGTRAKPTADQVYGAAVAVNVEPADGVQLGPPVSGNPIVGAVLPGFVQSDNNFTSYGAPPGQYVLRVTGAIEGWFVKSAMYAGEDRLDVPIELVSDINNVVVKYADKAAGIAGTVIADSESRPDRDAMVLLFPRDPREWKKFGVASRRMLSARTSRHGIYEFLNVPDGDYFAVAVPVSAAADWQEPASLERFAQVATRISVRDAMPQRLDLRTAKPQNP